MSDLDIQTEIKQAFTDVISEVVEQDVIALNKYYSPIVTDLQQRINDYEAENCSIHQENMKRNVKRRICYE